MALDDFLVNIGGIFDFDMSIPFALQIMNMSGWILEIGSNIFRQIGTVRDSMETIAQPITLIDAPLSFRLGTL